MEAKITIIGIVDSGSVELRFVREYECVHMGAEPGQEEECDCA